MKKDTKKTKILCTKCGYDLTNMGSRTTKNCPGCGKSTQGVLHRSLFEDKSAKKFR